MICQYKIEKKLSFSLIFNTFLRMIILKIKNFALIGYNINYSLSPFIHERLFKISKINAQYNLINLKDITFQNYREILKKLDGYNVTIPHKINIIPFLDNLNDEAQFLGSVNTVKNSNSLAIGYNTDVDAFLLTMKNHNVNLKGNILILGYGGLARALASKLLSINCNVILAVRKNSLEKAKNALSFLKNKSFDNSSTFKIYELESLENLIKNNLTLLINATPVGTFPNANDLPVSENIIKKCDTVFDAVYNPYKTALLKEAKNLSKKTIDGIEMLVLQAMLSHRIWTGAFFHENDIRRLITETKVEIDRKFKI